MGEKQFGWMCKKCFAGNACQQDKQQGPSETVKCSSCGAEFPADGLEYVWLTDDEKDDQSVDTT
jgi:hypothetical protein